jgi:hypothetical protein
MKSSSGTIFRDALCRLRLGESWLELLKGHSSAVCWPSPVPTHLPTHNQALSKKAATNGPAGKLTHAHKAMGANAAGGAAVGVGGASAAVSGTVPAAAVAAAAAAPGVRLAGLKRKKLQARRGLLKPCYAGRCRTRRVIAHRT